MKKSVLFVVIVLLATGVFAAENLESNYTKTIPRYSDFPLDNIHILRLQDAAVSLGGNVSELRSTVEQMEERRSGEISLLTGSLDSFQRSMIAQVAALQNSIESLEDRIDSISPRPELSVPADIRFPPYMLVLLGANVFLLVIVIILIFWLREQYYVHRENHAEEHIHPAPPELIGYVKHQLEHDRKLHDVRMELAGKGWTPSIIEHAIHAAKEK
jgi:hypothetical protein